MPDQGHRHATATDVLVAARPAYRVVTWAPAPVWAPVAGLLTLVGLTVVAVATEAGWALALGGAAALYTAVAGLLAGPAIIYLHTIEQLQAAGIDVAEIQELLAAARGAVRGGQERTPLGLPRSGSEVFAEHAAERLRQR